MSWLNVLLAALSAGYIGMVLWDLMTFPWSKIQDSDAHDVVRMRELTSPAIAHAIMVVLVIWLAIIWPVRMFLTIRRLYNAKDVIDDIERHFRSDRDAQILLTLEDGEVTVDVLEGDDRFEFDDDETTTSIPQADQPASPPADPAEKQ